MIASFTIQKSILVLGDVALIFIATFLSPLIRLGKKADVFYAYIAVIFISIFFYLIMMYIFDLYNMNRRFGSWDSLIRITLAVLSAGSSAGLVLYFLKLWAVSRAIFIIQMFLVLVLLLSWRLIFSLMFPVSIVKESVIVLGAGGSGAALSEVLESRLSPYTIVGFLDDDQAKLKNKIGSSVVIGRTDDLLQIASRRNIKTAIIAITHDRPKRLIHSILEAKLKGMNIIEMPTACERLTRRVPVAHIHDEWLLFAGGFYLFTKEYLQKIKRLIDLSLSSLFIILTLPVLGIIALAIKLDSKGPVFYKQIRIGKGAEEFTLWKFRSMVSNAEENGPVWASKNDHRLTRVGKIIRFLRIDEMPQLFNVLRGEMSLIGPRPERVEFVRELESRLPYYAVRHTVLPGVTGWAQVNYRYGASVDDALHKLEYDLYYIKNMSLFLDLKILLKTIGVVLFGQGAR